MPRLGFSYSCSTSIAKRTASRRTAATGRATAPNRARQKGDSRESLGALCVGKRRRLSPPRRWSAITSSSSNGDRPITLCHATSLRGRPRHLAPATAPTARAGQHARAPRAPRPPTAAHPASVGGGAAVVLRPPLVAQHHALPVARRARHLAVLVADGLRPAALAAALEGSPAPAEARMHSSALRSCVTATMDHNVRVSSCGCFTYAAAPAPQRPDGLDLGGLSGSNEQKVSTGRRARQRQEFIKVSQTGVFRPCLSRPHHDRVCHALRAIRPA